MFFENRKTAFKLTFLYKKRSGIYLAPFLCFKNFYTTGVMPLMSNA
jgi:hypothetical protein